MAVQKFVRYFTGGIFVGEFEGLGAEPLDAYNGDKAVREDSPNRSV